MLATASVRSRRYHGPDQFHRSGSWPLGRFATGRIVMNQQRGSADLPGAGTIPLLFKSCHMPASIRASLLAAAALLAPATCHAMDDFVRASSSAPTEIVLCGDYDWSLIETAVCKEAGYDKLVAAIDQSFSAALAKSPANVRPLLKRDQVWFGQVIGKAATSLSQSGDENREAFAATLRQRVSMLNAIASGFGRPGLAGKWANAFGNVVVTPEVAGTYRLAVDMRAVYGANSESRVECKLNTTLKPGADGWLSGVVDEARPPPSSDDQAAHKKA